MLDASHWSRLPTEIRLQIYKFLVPENYTFKLTYENGRAVVAEDCHHNQTPVRKCIQTALFYVSKQISRESRELLFSVNTFVLCAGAWEMRPSTSTSLAPTFQVPPDVGLSQARSVFTVATLQSIQHLEIHISLTKVVTRQNYECIYGWLRGLASALKQSNSLKTLNARCILGIFSYNRQGFLIFFLKEMIFVDIPVKIYAVYFYFFLVSHLKMIFYEISDYDLFLDSMIVFDFAYNDFLLIPFFYFELYFELF